MNLYLYVDSKSTKKIKRYTASHFFNSFIVSKVFIGGFILFLYYFFFFPIYETKKELEKTQDVARFILFVKK